ncbi:MAG: lipid II:glycine glycyltransferase FemX [Nocardioidaceae bacterium]
MSSIVVRPISVGQHLEHIGTRPSASFLQTPAWGEVKTDWQHESLGWFADDRLIGTGLVLYRRLPRLNRSLAYLPEGPLLDWSAPDLAAHLEALASYLKRRKAFAVRLGPPAEVRSWDADTLKKAIADETVRRLNDVGPDATNARGTAVREVLRSAGWHPVGGDDENGFTAGQPQYVFQVDLADKTADDVLAGMNQLWRRNIKKAAKLGVEVRRATAADLAGFHRLYVETAERDGFTPRPLDYFERMFAVLQAEDPDRIRLYLACHEGDLVAATTWVRVGRHVWYSYGASTTAKREVRASNAIQWQMITDALDCGAQTYDLRGITDTVSSTDPHLGLLQFKVGTGGQAVEYVGEWDLPLNRLLHKAFTFYLSRR